LSNNPDFKNPYAGDPGGANPYASPPPVYGSDAHRPREAGRQLMAPAIVLLVMAILTALHRFADFFISAYMFMGAEAQQKPILIGALIFDPLILILSIVTIIGCIAMLRLSSLPAARSAAIISVIPVCAPCVIFGIPFGIWALVLLARPEVASSFQKQA
jgi:hypothetical protein